MTIPMHLREELYTASTRNQSQNLEDLMQVLSRIVEQHADGALLQNVAKLLNLYSKRDVTVAHLTEGTRNEILDGLAAHMRQAMHPFEAQSEDELEEEDERDEGKLLASYTKVAAFSACLDIHRCNLWDITLKMVKNEQEKFHSADLIEKGVLLLFRQLAWDLESVKDVRGANADDVRELNQKKQQFLACTKSILENSAPGMENAYFCLCDALMIFNFAIAVDVPEDDLMRLLPIKLNDAFTARITDFVAENVFASLEDESFIALDSDAQVQLMEKRRSYLACFVKLIAYGAFPVIDASLVLRHYNKFSHHFDDILKTLVQKCRAIDGMATAKAIILSLMSVYKELKAFSTDNIVDTSAADFYDLRETSKRFAQSFGVDIVRIREAVVMIHKDGIAFALDVEEQRRLRVKDKYPQDICFLEVLIDFSPKLVSQDKTTVLTYLQKHCPVKPEPSFDDEELDAYWEPYLNYKKSLLTNKTAQ